jgi:D-alanine-D-alanine ligase-like ATP-grasp enzyme
LYLGRKFDIRQWVILNASDGRVYLYSECYVRTSSKEYTDYDPSVPEDDQIYRQVTNNAVQRDGEDYGKFEEGNIVSPHTLFDFIAQSKFNKNGESKKDLQGKFTKDMERLVVDTMKSVKGKILNQKHTFELLGYDFIIDEALNTILIEVNTNPCLEESNALLRKLLPRMVDDMFNVVLDPLFGDS